MIKSVSAILFLLGVSAVSALGQQPAAEPLSYGDVTAIVQAVLEQTNKLTLLSNPANIKTISSENIEFVDSSQLAKYGITLVSASSLSERKEDYVHEYLLFRNISMRDDVAVITLTKVTEGRPCFSSSFRREKSYTYEVRRTSKGLIAESIPPPGPKLSWKWKPFAAAP
jgi:hypothetical protein